MNDIRSIIKEEDSKTPRVLLGKWQQINNHPKGCGQIGLTPFRKMFCFNRK